MQHVHASYVPKEELPCPSACLVFLWGQVAALSRLGNVAHTVLVGHFLTSLQERCVLRGVPGCALSSFPSTTAVSRILRVIPVLFSALTGARMA